MSTASLYLGPRATGSCDKKQQWPGTARVFRNWRNPLVEKVSFKPWQPAIHSVCSCYIKRPHCSMQVGLSLTNVYGWLCGQKGKLIIVPELSRQRHCTTTFFNLVQQADPGPMPCSAWRLNKLPRRFCQQPLWQHKLGLWINSAKRHKSTNAGHRHQLHHLHYCYSLPYTTYQWFQKQPILLVRLARRA